MKTTYGNLIEIAKLGHCDVLVHGCNTRGTMGAGIAQQIAQEFPGASIVDQGSLHIPQRLGKYTFATVDNNYGNPLTIVNAYTQDDHRKQYRGQNLADYNAINNVFGLIAQNFGDKIIAYPKIGAGLAGGDWDIISTIIDQQLQNCDHFLVEYDPNVHHIV